MNHRHQVRAPGFRGSYPHIRRAANAAKKHEFAVIICDGHLVAAVVRGELLVPIGGQSVRKHFEPIGPVREERDE